MPRKPPAEPIDHHYNIPKLNRAFFAAGALLTAVFVLMVVADYKRDWKSIQQTFLRLDRDKTRAAVEAYEQAMHSFCLARFVLFTLASPLTRSTRRRKNGSTRRRNNGQGYIKTAAICGTFPRKHAAWPTSQRNLQRSMAARRLICSSSPLPGLKLQTAASESI